MLELQEPIIEDCSYFRAVYRREIVVSKILKHLNHSGDRKFKIMGKKLENLNFIHRILKLLNKAKDVIKQNPSGDLSDSYAPLLDSCLCQNPAASSKFDAFAYLIENYNKTFEYKNNQFVAKPMALSHNK